MLVPRGEASRLALFLTADGHWQGIMDDRSFEGVIAKYDGARGFGFIRPDDSCVEDLFFHVTRLRGVFEPAAGQRVRYEFARNRNDGRLRAVDVQLVGAAAAGESNRSSGDDRFDDRSNAA